jgi:hypothetical protein
MALLRMFNRSAFICNVCFLLAITILWIHHPVNAGLASLLIVMGFFLSFIFNLVVNVWLFIRMIIKKPINEVPRALIYLNGSFLAIQLILLFK